MPLQGNRNRVYKRQNDNLGEPNLLLGRTSLSGMLKVVLSESPFRDQPYISIVNSPLNYDGGMTFKFRFEIAL